MQGAWNRSEIIKRLKRIVAASPFYSDIMPKELLSDEYTSLKVFLNSYAHERNVSVRKYADLACLTISNLYQGEITNIRDDDPEKAWEIYKSLRDDKYPKIKLNKSHNPMNEDNGVLRVMKDHKIIHLSKFLVDQIKNDELKKAHKILMKIRGVADKIASLYLRDLVTSAKIDENTLNDTYLLQPADIWVDRGLELLLEKVPKNMVKKQKAIDKLCKTHNISGIEFNRGCWFLGSKIADDKDHFKDLVLNGKCAKKSYLQKYMNVIDTRAELS